MAKVTGYDETDDPIVRLMYEAGWMPAPRLDASTTIPKPTDLGSVLILGGKGWVPGGGNALRGSVLRRYLETYMGPLDQKLDFESFVSSAAQMGLLRQKQTPIPVQTVDPIANTLPPVKSQKELEYEEYLEKLKKAKTVGETQGLGNEFKRRWGI